MASSLAVTNELATRKDQFAAHLTDTQRVFLCSETKQDPLAKTLKRDLHRFEFYQPSPAFCRALVIDIDHIFAFSYIQDLPAEIKPHAVVLTAKGVQAFWLIEGLPLTEKAHQAPISFAQDVAEMLRRACNGDPAVNPLTPSKCRNPLYSDADVFFLAECPPYALKALVEPLRAYLRGFEPSEPTEPHPTRSRAVWGDLVAGQRNETIFHTIRRTAYRGGDFEAQAYELNALCAEPLPLSEVDGIIRSVQKFMEKRYKPSEARREQGDPMPEQLRDFMAEIGRKGGSRKTEAQKKAQNANLAKGANASRAVRSAQSIGRKAQVQALKESGYTQKSVAEKLGVTVRTVQRMWN